MLRDLATCGVELGIHIHPQSLGDHQYLRYLGEYGRQRQREIIQQGMDMFIQALKKRPTSFRPGNFSASDDTFALLSDLGFRQGSVSDPGRYVPEYAAVWKGACLYPHWANANDRLKAGYLPFLEVPVTTDPDRRHPNGFPYELRIESGTFRNWHVPIISQALERMALNNVEFRTLCLFTHDYFEYSYADADQTKTLEDIVRYFNVLRDEYDVVSGTLAALRDRFVEDVRSKSMSTKREQDQNELQGESARRP